ncbi:MAG: universal stress protein [Chloroflexota bacterium]
MRILVATDGSECAAVAVDLAAAIEWPPDSIIHIVEAVATGLAVFGGPWPPLPPVDTAAFDDDIRQQAEKDLSVAQARLTSPGRSVETSVASGRATDVIVSLAEQTGADVIVVGSRGHGTLESMILGSVSAEVIDRAHVPVLVARRTVIERVVYAWDGSACARQAAHVLMDWGVFATSEIQVLSVADVVPASWSGVGTVGGVLNTTAYDEAAAPSRMQHEQLAQRMALQLQEAGLEAVHKRRDGDPAGQIVNVAESWEADLVVVGTHGRTGLRRILMGSVARNVLHHAPCSVLIVREQPAGEGEEAPPGIA